MTTNTPSPANTSLEGLQDIVGPIRIVPLWQWVALAAVILVLLALTALALFLWLRARRKRLNQEPPPLPPIPAHTRALHSLEGALKWMSDPDRFCTEVSWILRSYIEERFGWNAADRTTEEFLTELRRHEELPESHRKLLADFLTGCDVVKFARHDPTEGELRALHTSAVRFVSDTVPPPPPPGAEARPQPAALAS